MKDSQFSLNLNGQSVLGVGTDLVRVSQFAALLEAPGSVFAEPGRIFTARELRRARERALAKGDTPAEHLAATWAIKEAALKAWVGALELEKLPLPLGEDQVVWAEITVSHSPAGAPQIRLIGEMARVFEGGVTRGLAQPTWHASASHDGDYASAFVVLSG